MLTEDVYAAVCTAGAQCLAVQGKIQAQPAGGFVVLLVQAGEYTLFAQGEPLLRLEEGQAALAAGAVTLMPLVPGVVWRLDITGSAARQLAPQCPVPRWLGALPGGAQSSFAQLAEQGEKLAPAAKSALAYQLLCRLLAGGAGRGLSPLVSAAVGEIHARYHELYGVEELAAELMVNKHHLIRCFTRELGTPPGRYLTAVKIARAKHLLLKNNCTVELVAGLCGFSSGNYFSRVFKKETGDTPLEYRAQAALRLAVPEDEPEDEPEDDVMMVL